METDANVKLSELERKIDAIYASVEKTRRYFFWTLIVTLALFILPLIGLAFALPSFIGSYASSFQEIAL